RKDLPVNNLKEFIAYAKANQSKMQYGSAGAGSATHLGCVLLNYLIGVDVTHVPYRGTGPAMQDLQGGRIDYLCEIVSTAKPQIDGGTVKPIAIMTKERSSALPNVPTGLEQGTPNLEAYTWNAIFLPKGVPADVVKKLNDATVQAMKTPMVKERLEGLGAGIVPEDRATPEYLGQFVKSGIEKWAGPVQASGGEGDLPDAPGPGADSLQFDLAFDLVGEGDPAERDRGLGRKLFVALEPTLRQGLADRLLDLALGAHSERLEELANAAVEHVFVHDRLRRAIIRLSG